MLRSSHRGDNDLSQLFYTIVIILAVLLMTTFVVVFESNQNSFPSAEEVLTRRRLSGDSFKLLGGAAQFGYVFGAGTMLIAGGIHGHDAVVMSGLSMFLLIVGVGLVYWSVSDSKNAKYITFFVPAAVVMVVTPIIVNVSRNASEQWLANGGHLFVSIGWMVIGMTILSAIGYGVAKALKLPHGAIQGTIWVGGMSLGVSVLAQNANPTSDTVAAIWGCSSLIAGGILAGVVYWLATKFATQNKCTLALGTFACTMITGTCIGIRSSDIMDVNGNTLVGERHDVTGWFVLVAFIALAVGLKCVVNALINKKGDDVEKQSRMFGVTVLTSTLCFGASIAGMFSAPDTVPATGCSIFFGYAFAAVLCMSIIKCVCMHLNKDNIPKSGYVFAGALTVVFSFATMYAVQIGEEEVPVLAHGAILEIGMGSSLTFIVTWICYLMMKRIPVNEKKFYFNNPKTCKCILGALAGVGVGVTIGLVANNASVGAGVGGVCALIAVFVFAFQGCRRK